MKNMNERRVKEGRKEGRNMEQWRIRKKRTSKTEINKRIEDRLTDIQRQKKEWMKYRTMDNEIIYKKERKKERKKENDVSIKNFKRASKQSEAVKERKKDEELWKTFVTNSWIKKERKR